MTNRKGMMSIKYPTKCPSKVNLPIDFFRHLKEIADKYKIKQNQWADKAGISDTRISEYVRRYKIEKKLVVPPKKENKRFFTLDVAHSLYQALKSIIGEHHTKKGIRECLEKESDPLKQIIIMVIIKYDEGDNEFILKAADYLKMLYKVSEG